MELPVKSEGEDTDQKMDEVPAVKFNVISRGRLVSAKKSPHPCKDELKTEREESDSKGVVMTITVTKTASDVTTTDVSKIVVPTKSRKKKKKKTKRVFVRELYNTKTKETRLEISTYNRHPSNAKALPVRVDAATNTLSELEEESPITVAKINAKQQMVENTKNNTATQVDTAYDVIKNSNQQSLNISPLTTFNYCDMTVANTESAVDKTLENLFAIGQTPTLSLNSDWSQFPVAAQPPYDYRMYPNTQFIHEPVNQNETKDFWDFFNSPLNPIQSQSNSFVHDSTESALASIWKDLSQDL